MPQQNRVLFIDSLRGLLLVIMAIDHVRSFVHRSHPTEIWGGQLPDYQGDGMAFLFRLITHVCAPGFFFLMGVSMVLTARKPIAPAQLRSHFIRRGVCLMLLQLLLVNLAWWFALAGQVGREHYGFEQQPGIESATFLYIGVIFALGLSMVAASFVLRTGLKWLLAMVFLVEFVPIFLIEQLSPREAISPVLAIFTTPGQSGIMSVRYTFMPWFALCVLGIVYGRWLVRQVEIADGVGGGHREAILGIALLAIFVVLRLLVTGDHYVPQDGWIGFLNVTKYPPSLAFQVLTLGFVLLICGVFRRWRPQGFAVLQCYGQATLCFYVVHLFLYGALAHLLFDQAASFGAVILTWLLGLILLYPICRAWSALKRRSPPQHWLHYL